MPCIYVDNTTSLFLHKKPGTISHSPLFPKKHKRISLRSQVRHSEPVHKNSMIELTKHRIEKVSDHCGEDSLNNTSEKYNFLFITIGIIYLSQKTAIP